MNKQTTRFALVAISMWVGTFGISQAVAADTYKIDPPHAFYLFRVNHFGTSFVYGRFNQGTGTFVVDSADPSKDSIEIEVKTDSVDTGVAARDKHLKTKDFFEVDTYPTMTFKSTEFKKTGDATFDVTGDFTLHGVTKKVTAKATFVGKGKDPKGAERAGWEATLTIKRSDFGMKTMVGPVGDEITITVSVEGLKQ